MAGLVGLSGDVVWRLLEWREARILRPPVPRPLPPAGVADCCDGRCGPLTLPPRSLKTVSDVVAMAGGVKFERTGTGKCPWVVPKALRVALASNGSSLALTAARVLLGEQRIKQFGVYLMPKTYFHEHQWCLDENWLETAHARILAILEDTAEQVHDIEARYERIFHIPYIPLPMPR